MSEPTPLLFGLTAPRPEQEPDHGARTHHPYSPSKLDNLEACPWFRQDNNENEKSRRGTVQHEAMDTGADDHLTDEEYRAVEMCRAHYEEIRKAAGGHLVELAEMGVAVDDENTTAGFFDREFITPTEIHVADTKFGQWAVRDSETNLQGISYRLGALRELFRNPDLVARCRFAFQDPDWTPESIRTLRVTFLLPYRNEVDSSAFPVEQANEHLLRIRTVVARAKNPQPGQENPNTFTCLFCNRKHECKALHALVIKVGEKYEPLQIPYPVEPMRVSEATPEQLAVGLKFFGILGGLAAAWRQQATLRAQTEEDLHVPGFQVVVSEKREIRDARKFAEVVCDAAGVDLATLVVEAGDFYLGKAEKLVSKIAPRGQKTLAIEALGQKLEESGAVERKPPTFTLKQKSQE